MDYIQANQKVVNPSIRTTATTTHRINGVIAGSFFIAATTSAIIGGVLYDPVFATDKHNVLTTLPSTRVTLGALFELVLVCSAIGTAIMLFPYLKRYDERLALGYLIFRTLEAVFIIVGLLSVLVLLSVSQAGSTAVNESGEAYQMQNTLLKSFYRWCFVLGPNFMLGINTLIYSFVFCKTALVPRPLAILGLSGAALIFITSILEMFGVVPSLTAGAVALAMPVAIFEMILAGWLISKGFNVAALQHSDSSRIINHPL